MKFSPGTWLVILMSAALGLAISVLYPYPNPVFAAGSRTMSGTAPNVIAAGVETRQAEMAFSGPLSTGTVKNVSYSYQHHRQCLTNPIGGCTYVNVPVQVYICGSSQIGVVYPEGQRTVTDIRCTPQLTALSGSTGAFNGMAINSTTRRLRLYWLFTGYGSGGFNPHLEGRTDSATVSW